MSFYVLDTTDILEGQRWHIVRIPIVETQSRPRRVVAAGSPVAMEALWFEMIEKEDDFYLLLEPVPVNEDDEEEDPCTS